MAWAKSLRNILGGQQPHDTSRPKFFEEKEMTLLEAPTLTAIRNESSKQQQNTLLMKKLKICSIICDFRLAQELGDMEEKKRIFNKTSILHEICTYLKTGTDWNTLEVVTQIFKTVSTNLFRPMPDSYHIEHLMGVDSHVPITYTLPSWQHLQIIYEILTITFSNKSINQLLLTEYIKKYDFINNFVYLLNTLDKNERHEIQSVLETFYNEHGNLFEKELIMHLINYCLDFIHYQIGSAEGIKSILNVFNSMSLIDAEIYMNILMPLHRIEYKHFRRYEFVLWIYCKRIIEEDETLSLILFHNILKYWPLTNAYKEQQFLKKIGVILDFIDEDLWQECDQQNNPKQYELFKSVAYKILYCLQNTYHYKTICDILDIIEQEEVQEFIDKYGGNDLWSKIYQSFYDIVTYFYYFETVNKTKETMDILKEQDDIPMKYRHSFNKIDNGTLRMFPVSKMKFIDIEKLKIKNDKNQKQIKSKQLQRKKKYDKLTKKAQRTSLYKKVKKQKEKEERERIEREKKAKKEQERKEKQQREDMEKRRVEREREYAKSKGISTPQIHDAPPPPPPKSKKPNTRTRSNDISGKHIESPPLSPKNKPVAPPKIPNISSTMNSNNNNNDNNTKQNKPVSPSPYFQRYMQLQKKKNAKAEMDSIYNTNNTNNNNNINNKKANIHSGAISNVNNVSAVNGYKIIPKKQKKQQQQQTNSHTSLPQSVPKVTFKKSQSAGDVLNNHHKAIQNKHNKVNAVNINSNKVISPKKKSKFWPSSRTQSRPNSPDAASNGGWFNNHNKTESEKNAEKERKRKEKEEKQRLKAEKQRQKDLEKAEKQKRKDAEKERKKKEKKDAKELKQREKEIKRSEQGRVRKSVDIDRRSSSISNPVRPKPNTAHYTKYQQITQNNQKNQYLNTQYYANNKNTNFRLPNNSPFGRKPDTMMATGKDNRKHTDYDKSPSLAFSYEPTATYDPPKVPLPTNKSANYHNHKNNRNNVHHNKAKSSHTIRTKTPPPPQKKLPTNNRMKINNNINNNKLAKPVSLSQNHPLRNKLNHKINFKSHSMNNIPTNKIQPPPHSGGTKKKLPPRPWPPK